MLTGKFVFSGCVGAVLGLVAGPALAGGSSGGNGSCGSLPSWSALKSALTSSITASAGGNGGLGFNMWGVIVDNSGIVCAVAFSGGNFTSQWLASRVIAAQKANTANSLSLSSGATPGGSAVGSAGLALSTANLFSAVQPGGSLYGLQHSNPVDTEVGYGNSEGHDPASASSFGTTSDPMVGQRIGGVNVFGGGLGIYKGGVRVGGLGVSGDQSCTDHMVAWRTRHTLNLDQLHGVRGPADIFANDHAHPDNIIFDITANPNGGTGNSATGFGHATCFNNPPIQTNGGPPSGYPTAAGLPAVQ
jgi:Haem-degrading